MKPGNCLPMAPRGDADNAIGDERRAGFEKRMRNQVEAIVSSVVGAGRARVQLSADFDYNKITQTSDRFDPEGRVLRSSQTREESSPPPRTAVRSPSTTNCQATRPGMPRPPRATRARRPRKPTTTRFPAPPRPK